MITKTLQITETVHTNARISTEADNNNSNIIMIIIKYYYYY